MKPGDVALIIPSIALKNMQLDSLVGYTGIVMEICGTMNNIKGCWIRFPVKYLNEYEWYIPYNSIGL